MQITDLPADEQALRNAIAEAMADEVRDEPTPDVELFLSLLAAQA